MARGAKPTGRFILREPRSSRGPHVLKYILHKDRDRRYRSNSNLIFKKNDRRRLQNGLQQLRLV